MMALVLLLPILRLEVMVKSELAQDILFAVQTVLIRMVGVQLQSEVDNWYFLLVFLYFNHPPSDVDAGGQVLIFEFAIDRRLKSLLTMKYYFL